MDEMNAQRKARGHGFQKATDHIQPKSKELEEKVERPILAEEPKYEPPADLQGKSIEELEAELELLKYKKPAAPKAPQMKRHYSEVLDIPQEMPKTMEKRPTLPINNKENERDMVKK